jgi:hypothetical protein
LIALLNLRSVSKASDNSGDFGSFLIHIIFDVDKSEKADNSHRNLGVVQSSLFTGTKRRVMTHN